MRGAFSEQAEGLADGDSLRPRVTVAQIGSRMHYAVPALFARAGMLERFYTDLYAGPGSALAPLARLGELLPERLKKPGLKRLLGRREESIPANNVYAQNLLGAWLTWRVQRARGHSERQAAYLNTNKVFCRAIAAQGFGKTDVVYSFNDASKEIVEAAKRRGHRTIVEQTIAPPRVVQDILSEESARWPGWEEAYPGLDQVELLAERNRSEWAAADVVVCASHFVVQGLCRSGVSEAKCRVVPYAVDLARFRPDERVREERRRGSHGGPIRALFVGGVNLRKGVQYLMDALELTGRAVECRVVGAVAIREPHLAHLGAVASILGPIPRSAVLEQYQWADVFVFPSVCEGSATVVYEALAAGLPVITTPNAGSVVRDGVDGFVVPIRDAVATADRLERLRADPALLAQMSVNAAERARDYSWERYGERLVALVKEVCEAEARA